MYYCSTPRPDNLATGRVTAAGTDTASRVSVDVTSTRATTRHGPGDAQRPSASIFSVRSCLRIMTRSASGTSQLMSQLEERHHRLTDVADAKMSEVPSPANAWNSTAG